MQGDALPVSLPTEGSLGGKRKAAQSWREEGRASATSAAVEPLVLQVLGILVGELGSKCGILAWLLAPVSSYWMDSLPFNLPHNCLCSSCSYPSVSTFFATKCQTHTTAR